MSLLNFVVFHVGGKGGIGESIRVLTNFKNEPNKKELYIFEADLSDGGDLYQNNKYIRKLNKRHGICVNILQYCISDHVGVEHFYINKDRWSSSLFKIDLRASNYLMESKDGDMWKDHCVISEVKNVNVTTFDEMYKNKLHIKPDFLSMDAQASEFSIMKGAKTVFDNDLLGVTTEVEFRELYEDQPLFSDQDVLLRNNGFIFIDLLNSQRWFIGPGVGKSFLTVGEVLYLKDYRYLVNKYKSDSDILIPIIFKLAIISKSLGYSSYSCVMIDYMVKKWNKQCILYVDDNNDMLVKNIFNFYKDINK